MCQFINRCRDISLFLDSMMCYARLLSTSLVMCYQEKVYYVIVETVRCLERPLISGTCIRACMRRLWGRILFRKWYTSILREPLLTSRGASSGFSRGKLVDIDIPRMSKMNSYCVANLKVDRVYTEICRMSGLRFETIFGMISAGTSIPRSIFHLTLDDNSERPE